MYYCTVYLFSLLLNIKWGSTFCSHNFFFTFSAAGNKHKWEVLYFIAKICRTSYPLGFDNKWAVGISCPFQEGMKNGGGGCQFLAKSYDTINSFSSCSTDQTLTNSKLTKLNPGLTFWFTSGLPRVY